MNEGGLAQLRCFFFFFKLTDPKIENLPFHSFPPQICFTTVSEQGRNFVSSSQRENMTMKNTWKVIIS